jgi:hypothetical protein
LCPHTHRITQSTAAVSAVSTGSAADEAVSSMRVVADEARNDNAIAASSSSSLADVTLREGKSRREGG